MKTDTLGKYSNHVINEVSRYCTGVQDTLIDQVQTIIDNELDKCNGHSSEYEIKLFVHGLKKQITKIQLL